MIKQREIIKGIKSLGPYFRKEKARFAGAPILIIEGDHVSSNINTSKSNRHRHGSAAAGGGGGGGGGTGMVETMAGRQIHLVLAQQMGFRTVVSKGGLTDGAPIFPTQHLVDQQLELLARVGATTVCGVGSRASLDLAKAVAKKAAETHANTISHDSQDDTHQLILVPDTLEAVLASSHPYSLMLDAEEDVLVPYPATATAPIMPSTTVALLESDNFFSFSTSRKEQDLRTAIDACLAILLDSLRHYQQKSDHDQNLEQIVKKAKQSVQECLQLLPTLDMIEAPSSSNTDEHKIELRRCHDFIVDKLIQTGSTYLEFGLAPGSVRSAPLAIMASLLPSIFPDKDSLAIMASVAPALPRLLMESPHAKKTNTTEVLDTTESVELPPPLLTTLEPVDKLMDLIQSNQIHWNCLDAPQRDLRALVEPLSLLSPPPSKQPRTA
ncbi:hypothetical protein ACA910_017363 [Epithemia clementina (nom. ined.)]